ncbi:ATP-dependent DNA helicase DinG [Gordonia effusa NBRC 100432]|uniref:ATP-dependent helicase DinG n=1 Tax=Gordonia effusa NBRC 100432 TaxID=1077974 RepID=H0R6F8_9ACTN|nr:ATP-dependent DNA helicase DinG [Gordonia effusa NBRC 100432]
MSKTAATIPSVTTLLETAVDALGGASRPGQIRMANAVAHAIDTGEHLAVQAGTGTGKSLAYLIPAIAHAMESGKTVVVSTATIALQRQLVERDLPRLSKALTKSLGSEPKFAILKGRSNYLCLNKIHGGVVEEPDTALYDAFELSRTGREVTRLREWVSETETGDRDDLTPGVVDRSWKQVSVSARECLGASNCSYAEDCFAEKSRMVAGQADVIVTNHAMLAIDALSPANILPEHDVVIIDEAHELTDRITAVSTAELSAASITLAARRCAKLIDDELVDDIVGAAEQFGELLADTGDESAPRRLTRLPHGYDLALASLRDRLWKGRNAIGPVKKAGALDPDAAAARSAATTSLEELHDTAVRVLGAFDDPNEANRRDVVWVAHDRFRNDTHAVLRVAPLSVGGLLRASLFANSTVILTSATLVVGGSFDALAATWGLPAHARADGDAPTDPAAQAVGDITAAGLAVPSDSEDIRWRGLDAGSPFDYPKSAILYIARHLPPPGRAAMPEAARDELKSLMAAAGGRTLGLFSSMRAAKEAAALMREETDHRILCQGDDMTSTLVREFTDDAQSCLFGTLSLWQGVDVPGPSLSLVVIDRIPFPRPDDPLLTARQRAVEARGGNGFMAVAANHAALLLAQGAGRLLRSVDDRGVVAVLDSRLANARYGGYLVKSLPPFWQTTNTDIVLGALRRLAK